MPLDQISWSKHSMDLFLIVHSLVLTCSTTTYNILVRILKFKRDLKILLVHPGHSTEVS